MSVNKVILVGRIGKDPDTRYMTSGEAVTNITLATSETWKDKSGDKQENTTWHNLVFYKKLAEIAGEYLKKGSQIYVEGRIQNRKYQDKEGKDRYVTEIIVNEMKMLGGKPEEDKKDRSAPEKPKEKPEPSGGFDDMDEDIPFSPHGFRGAGVCWRMM